MDQVITLPSEINRLCRTCMTVAGNDCFYENALVENSCLTDLGDMLQYLTSVEILSDDLPTVLCDSCVDNLKQAYEYKKQCSDAELNLKKLLLLFDSNNTSINQEEIEDVKLTEFEDVKLTEFEDFEKSPKNDGKETTCSTCMKKFESLYEFCVHKIEHEKDKTLLQRFQENCKEDIKGIMFMERNIPVFTLELISDRKKECIDIKSGEFELKLNDEIKNLLSDSNKDIECSRCDFVLPSNSNAERILLISNSPEKSKIENTLKHNPTVDMPRKKIISNIMSTIIICNYCSKTFSSLRKRRSHVCPEKEKKKNNEMSGNREPDNSICCDLCDKVFPNIAMISIHFIYHILLEETMKNSEIIHEWIFCNKCGQLFENEDNVEEHKNRNPDCQSIKILCEKCGISFDKDMDLILHEEQNHAEYELKDTYSCPICNEYFYEKELLLDHGANHLLKKLYCRECKLEYCSQATLNEHMKQHPRYKHICKVCGKCLSSSSALNSHMMGIHTKHALHMCNVCGKCFKTSNRMRIHKQIHSTHKKYMCSYCGYRSHKSGDLTLHMRIHTSEHPYKCTFANCMRQFKTSSHYNQHLRHHLDIRQYQCKFCSRRFSHSYTLKLHIMRHTGERPHSCVVCASKFRRKDHLRIHMKQHQK